MLSPEWLVMLGADGTVIGVDGGAPSTWVSRHLDACLEVPGQVRAAARRLLADLGRSLRPSAVQHTKVAAAAPEQPSFTVVAVGAIPLWPDEVDLLPMIDRWLRPLRRQAESLNVTLSLEHAGEIPRRLSIDGTKIGWAVTTLVGSALRHASRGPGGDPGHVHVRLVHNARQGTVSITVKDDGPGILESLQPWLFEPDPETGRPVGVALLMVHEVVGAHGGGVVVKSSTEGANRGTIVTICLPAAH